MPTGIGQGEPLRLDPFQKDFIHNVYDPVDSAGRRLIRRALLSIARKNGKSALAAGLVLAHLVGPEAKTFGEVVSAASDREQAAHIYKMAAQMIQLDPELSQLCKCLDTTKTIAVYHLGAKYRSLAADARRQHGGNPDFVIYDELAQAPNRELYDVLATSFGAKDEALLMAISTQSNDPESIMSELADDAMKQEAGELVDPTFYGKVYAVPENADIYDEANWKLANPALGTFKSLIHMRSLAHKAKRSPAAEAAFRNLELNQRVDGVVAFVSSQDWKACGAKTLTDDELAPYECFGGLDLSSRHDLTALALVWVLPGGKLAARSYFWMPGEDAEDVQERGKRDGAPYHVWHNQGHLNICEGRTVPYARVIRDINALRDRFNIKAIAYDRWRVEDFRAELKREGLDEEKWNLHNHGQGFKDMAPALDALETAILEHSIYHNSNPVLTYCMSNVKLSRDDAGNRKFDKKRKNRRIDGAVALAMAVAASTRAEIPEVQGPSVYEKRGVLAF